MSYLFHHECLQQLSPCHRSTQNESPSFIWTQGMRNILAQRMKQKKNMQRESEIEMDNIYFEFICRFTSPQHTPERNKKKTAHVTVERRIYAYVLNMLSHVHQNELLLSTCIYPMVSNTWCLHFSSFTFDNKNEFLQSKSKNTESLFISLDEYFLKKKTCWNSAYKRRNYTENIKPNYKRKNFFASTLKKTFVKKKFSWVNLVWKWIFQERAVWCVAIFS